MTVTELNKNQLSIIAALKESELNERELIEQINFVASKLGRELQPLLRSSIVSFSNGCYYLSADYLNKKSPAQESKTSISNGCITVLKCLNDKGTYLYGKQIREATNLNEVALKECLSELSTKGLICSPKPSYTFLSEPGTEYLLELGFTVNPKVKGKIERLKKLNLQSKPVKKSNQLKHPLSNVDKDIKSELENAFGCKNVDNYDNKLTFLVELQKYLPTNLKTMASSIGDDLRRFHG